MGLGVSCSAAGRSRVNEPLDNLRYGSAITSMTLLQRLRPVATAASTTGVWHVAAIGFRKSRSLYDCSCMYRRRHKLSGPFRSGVDSMQPSNCAAQRGVPRRHPPEGRHGAIAGTHPERRCCGLGLGIVAFDVLGAVNGYIDPDAVQSSGERS